MKGREGAGRACSGEGAPASPKKDDRLRMLLFLRHMRLRRVDAPAPAFGRHSRLASI
jgi:hypothetical protein